MPRPQILELPFLANGEAYFEALRPLGDAFWLDSGRPYATSGRYDIMSAAPAETFADPCEELLRERYQTLVFNEISTQNLPPFMGGIVGFFNYEFRHKVFQITTRKTDCLESVFGEYRWSLCQDHHAKKCWLVSLDNNTKFLEKLARDLRQHISTSTHKTPEFHCEEFRPGISADRYRQAFDRIYHYLLAGDCYQINFTQKFSAQFSGDPYGAYKTLRQAMPSPFSAYVELDHQHILSFSPERFIAIRDGKAVTQPIKGTAPRGHNPEKDQALAAALHRSQKNRAENVMIVDLLRNDFSRNCETHSVNVPQLFELQSFANVHHLVSTVEGKLQSGIDPVQFFLDCFPGGSITGAPKKRAMEIIDELESTARNAYCGSIAYFSACGNADSNIAIRTLLQHKDVLECWGGGGIVADSICDEEFEESLQKVKLLMDVLTDKH